MHVLRRIACAQVFVVILNLPLTVTLVADTIRVPGDQPTIQAGIDAAVDGDTVLVADGVYTGAGNTDISFAGKSISVRSENGPEGCTIDCQEGGRGFYFHSGEDERSVLHGFTVKNGRIDSTEGFGCGIYCYNASPRIVNNIITKNSGHLTYGGGIACRGDSSPMIINCMITENDSLGGAGIAVLSGSFPTITGCTITNNLGCYGGGIYCGLAGATITDNTISGNGGSPGGEGGGIFIGYDPFTSIVAGNTIIGNHANYTGGGINIVASHPVIRGNIITGNFGGLNGGGIMSWESWSLDGPPSHPAPVMTIADNNISGNETFGFGGGIYSNNVPVIITNNLIYQNSAFIDGGGICCDGLRPSLVTFNTIVENELTDESAYYYGGGISCWDANMAVVNCIIKFNDLADISASAGDAPTVSYSDVPWPGETNINENPGFVVGPRGDFYLGHWATGDPINSPCRDAGDPASEPFGSTRTDGIYDSGVVDMGYHYPAAGLVAGPGPAIDNPPQVRLFSAEQDATCIVDFHAYGASSYGVNVSCGNLDGDFGDEILTGPGPGDIYGPHTRGFEMDGTALAGLSFLAYGTKKYGVNVAAGDIDGDSFDEIITGAGPGAVFGPHVRSWNYDGTGSVTAMTGVNFFAYGTPKWGVNITAGDIDGDGFDEIVSGAGPGAVYGPHVRGWNVDGGTAVAIADVSFLAYGTNQYGVNVTCGDMDGDGIDEIVTGPGPGALFGAHVRGWGYDGTSTAPMPGFSFFAWSPDDVRFGARVFSGVDLDGDGRDDLLVSGGPDPDLGSPVNVYQYDGAQVAEWFSLEAFPGMTHGTNVAAGSF